MLPIPFLKRELFVRAGFFVLALFQANIATAQMNHSRKLADIKPAICNDSTLSTAHLLESIHYVIANRDLTNLSFLEKTLGATFKPRFDATMDDSPDFKSDIYTAPRLLGSPIAMQLVVNHSKSAQTQDGYIALITFGTAPYYLTTQNFMADCLGMTTADVSSYLDVRFPPLAPVPAGPTPDRGLMVELKTPGKDGPKLALSVLYNSETNLVSDLSLEEHP